jgi:Protein of unknown function (DUF2924)
MPVSRANAGAERLRRRESLQADMEAVSRGRLPELRDIWRERLDEEPPALRSREIFRRMLAYRLQEAVHGGLCAASRRKLDQIEARRSAPEIARITPPRVRLGAGATLIREWKGVRHEVRVIPDGFVHDGRTYKSLSEVARAITGTRWNGPLFFGLREKKEAA